MDAGAAAFEPSAAQLSPGGVRGPGDTALDAASFALPGLIGGHGGGGHGGAGAGAAAAPAPGAARRRVWTTRFLPERIYEHYAAATCVGAAARA